ncbi:MAG: sugar phosphate isomerase/epimerase [Lentisphaerae bacterium]|nr:sugar phosphate isomerase/epimerase [Lentisphaerota bacterium]
MQNYEQKRAKLVEAFRSTMETSPDLKQHALELSWSNWGFGLEPLADSAKRLATHGITWIELHGNRYGADLGYRANDVLDTLGHHGISVAGVCGMFGSENDLSSNSGIVRQNAIDYIRRQLDLCHAVGATYMLVVPGAVGRPRAYDDMEFERSVETLRLVADDFVAAGVRAAIEPIRSAEVSLVHTIADAKRYIAAVDHPGVAHINGDAYHMQSEEANVAEAICEAGDSLINLHLADSNRSALGAGSLDLDAVIMALYVAGFAGAHRFATPEPLGPGGNPYPAMFGRPDPQRLDTLVGDTARYWRDREAALKS